MIIDVGRFRSIRHHISHTSSIIYHIANCHTSFYHMSSLYLSLSLLSVSLSLSLYIYVNCYTWYMYIIYNMCIYYMYVNIVDVNILYVYIYIYICTYMYTHIYIYFLLLFIYIYISTYIFTYAYKYIYAHMYTVIGRQFLEMTSYFILRPFMRLSSCLLEHTLQGPGFQDVECTFASFGWVCLIQFSTKGSSARDVVHKGWRSLDSRGARWGDIDTWSSETVFPPVSDKVWKSQSETFGLAPHGKMFQISPNIAVGTLWVGINVPWQKVHLDK